MDSVRAQWLGSKALHTHRAGQVGMTFYDPLTYDRFHRIAMVKAITEVPPVSRGGAQTPPLSGKNVSVTIGRACEMEGTTVAFLGKCNMHLCVIVLKSITAALASVTLLIGCHLCVERLPV